MKIGNVKKDGIYTSANLAKKLGIEKISQDSLSFTISLPDTRTMEMEHLLIDGILGYGAENYYSDNQDIIYMPIHQLSQMIETKALLVYATHYNTTDVLKGYIETLDTNLGVYRSFSRITQITEALNQINTFGPFLLGVLLVICMMLIFLIYSRYIGTRKKEIILLR